MANLEDWDGALPAVLVAPVRDQDARRGLLRALVARVSELAPESVKVAHEEGRAPRLLKPASAGFRLSSASRAGIAALAVGWRRIGVDIEAVEPGIELPSNVLHPEERAWLSGLAGHEQARGFARLWAVKEAYLKGLRTGLRREPSSFAALPGGNHRAEMRVIDPEQPVVSISTAWVTQDGQDFAVALAELPP